MFFLPHWYVPKDEIFKAKQYVKKQAEIKEAERSIEMINVVGEPPQRKEPALRPAFGKTFMGM